MKNDDFARSLLRSARALDIPKEGAKDRAVAHLASSAIAAGAGAAVIAGSKTASATKLGALVWTIAAAAAIAGAAGGYGVARVTIPQAEKPTAVPSIPHRESVASPSSLAVPDSTAMANGGVAAEPRVDACTQTRLPEAPPKTCSQKGKPVPFRVTNACGTDVDLFWIDSKCEEVFHQRLPAGASWRRVSQEGHVWRIRDHATHALLKEFAPMRVPGAPELVQAAPRRTLPDVVVHAQDKVTEAPKEEAPTACSGYGQPTKFTLRNDRAEQVVLMWVGFDCEEKYHERLAPEQSLVVNGVDADAWRVRDAKTGAIVTDILPEVPDTVTYVTVP